jgi:protein-L-isoaspartate(D-aspartate) O-methyltransferase
VADLERARENLLRYLDHEIADNRVVDAMRRVPREAFVSPEQYHVAYDDRPLSIGFGQTISQPFIVALMVQALELRGDEKVLELGTGSGYEAAILAESARKVITVECIPELAKSARQVLGKLGYSNIEVHVAGRILGWPEGAPYDAIIVSAGAPTLPQVLLEQLTLNGRLVIPVGSRWQQELLRVTKLRKGNRIENLGGC